MLQVRALLLISSFAAIGCASSQRGREPEAFDPETLGADIQAQRFSFAFQYSAPPPAGRGVRATAVTGVPEACKLFEGQETPDDFTAYNFHFGATLLQEYEISPFEQDAESAFVEVVTMRGGRAVASVAAAGGTVRYESGPRDEDEWPGSARFSVDAEFERDPISATRCDGGMNIATGEIVGSCECTRFSGDRFFCDTTTRNCCYDSVDEVERVQFVVDAQPCASQCMFTQPELGEYCRALQ